MSDVTQMDLFCPVRMEPLTLKNRIAMAPMPRSVMRAEQLRDGAQHSISAVWDIRSEDRSIARIGGHRDTHFMSDEKVPAVGGFLLARKKELA